MEEMIYGEIVLESKNGKRRCRLFVTDDGKLAVKPEMFVDAGKKWIEAEAHQSGTPIYVVLK